MTISKKKLITLSSLIVSIVVLAFFGTPCYSYTSRITGGSYYLGYDFGFGGNVVIEAFTATLVCVIGVIALFNIAVNFLSKVNEKHILFTNVVLWLIAIAFAICCLCSKYVNVSYNPTNSIIFILVATIVGLVSSIGFYLVEQND